MNDNNSQPRTSLAETLMAEGVTDKDIRWWQNQNAKEKQKIKDIDATYRLTHIHIYVMDMHLSMDEAFLRTMKDFAFYEEYPPRDGIINKMKRLGLSQSDYPFPYELHARIDAFLTRLAADEASLNNFKKQKSDFSTMDAFIRHKIKSGEI
jgi:hypothetical protein